MYLKDKHRVEIALPSHMMLAIILAGVEDRETEEFKYLKENAVQAASEVLADLSPNKAGSLARRTQALHNEAMAPFLTEGVLYGKLGLIVFYFIKAITESGYLRYEEGSPFENAALAFMEALQEHASVAAMDRSAQKQARKLLQGLQALGYYSEVDFESIEV
jgi:hypothetical protein